METTGGGWLFCLSFTFILLGCDAYSLQVPGGDCCWGDNAVADGATALTLPECCTAFVCRQGRMVKEDFGHPGEKGCCEFDGVLYPSGAFLPGHCVRLQCTRGEWIVAKTEDCCSHCSVYDDSHFTTFDGHYYDFHGTCNYSLAQTDYSLEPHTAVYAHFKPCWTSASCVHHATFRENPNTIVTLGPQPSMLMTVNGEAYPVPATGLHTVTTSTGTHPLIVWQDQGCLHVLGASQIMILFCPHHLDIWAYPTLVNSLHGICGHFSYYINDDLTSRSGSVTPLTHWPLAVPESWKAAHQVDKSCQKECTYCPAETTDPCKAGLYKRQEFLATCRRVLHPVFGRDAEHLSHRIDSCVFDLCMLDQSGATGEERRKVLVIIRIITYTQKRHLAKLDGWKPSLPPTTECSPGARWMTDCNWCTCNDQGTAASCTLMFCSDFIPTFGEAVCEDGSVWRSGCNWCECLRGGMVCTHDDCDRIPIPDPIPLPTVPPTLPPVPTILPPDPFLVCRLPVAPGNCREYLPRFYYDPLTRQCKDFVYTGCNGNPNNFVSVQECLNTCVRDTTFSPKPSHCFLPLETGPCKGSFPRYGYNPNTGSCESFIYGGCLGNENNFVTAFQCFQECSDDIIFTIETSPTPAPTPIMPGHTPGDCLLPIEAGSCLNFTVRYAYDHKVRMCKIFFYGGCEGNANNFPTLQRCMEVCEQGNVATPSTYTTSDPYRPPTSITYPTPSTPYYPPAPITYPTPSTHYYPPTSETYTTRVTYNTPVPYSTQTYYQPPTRVTYSTHVTYSTSETYPTQTYKPPTYVTYTTGVTYSSRLTYSTYVAYTTQTYQPPTYGPYTTGVSYSTRLTYTTSITYPTQTYTSITYPTQTYYQPPTYATYTTGVTYTTSPTYTPVTYPTQTYTTSVTYPTQTYTTSVTYPTQTYTTSVTYPTQTYTTSVTYPTQTYITSVTYPTQTYITSVTYPTQTYITSVTYPTQTYITSVTYPTQTYITSVTYPTQTYITSVTYPTQTYITSVTYPTQTYITSVTYPTQTYITSVTYPTQTYYQPPTSVAYTTTSVPYPPTTLPYPTPTPYSPTYAPHPHSTMHNVPVRCLLPKDPGPCHQTLPRYFYNWVSGQCERFVFGGCEGNDNNFSTMEECKRICLYCKYYGV